MGKCSSWGFAGVLSLVDGREETLDLPGNDGKYNSMTSPERKATGKILVIVNDFSYTHVLCCLTFTITATGTLNY